MQLDKENMKKIRYLIAFAILLYLGVQHLDIVIGTAKVLLGFLFPFILGCGIAFILNVPMKFIEKHLFGKAVKQQKKAAMKLARPVSLCAYHCYAGSSAGAGCNSGKCCQKDRGKYTGDSEVDRYYIWK